MNYNLVYNDFVDFICEKYNITDRQQLLDKYNEIVDKYKSTSEYAVANKMINCKLDYNTFKVSDLKQLCKDKKLLVGGKKQELIDRLIRFDNGESSDKDKKQSPLKKGKVEKSPPKILTKIKAEQQIFKSYINEDIGHKQIDVVDNDNKFIFIINDEKKVIGLNVNNRLQQLTPKLIDICHKYKLQYVIPDSLKNDETDKNSDSEKEVEEVEVEEIEEEKKVEEKEVIDEDSYKKTLVEEIKESEDLPPSNLLRKKKDKEPLIKKDKKKKNKKEKKDKKKKKIEVEELITEE